MEINIGEIGKIEEMKKRIENKVEISMIKDRIEIRIRLLVSEVVMKCVFSGKWIGYEKATKIGNNDWV